MQEHDAKKSARVCVTAALIHCSVAPRRGPSPGLWGREHVVVDSTADMGQLGSARPPSVRASSSQLHHRLAAFRRSDHGRRRWTVEL